MSPELAKIKQNLAKRSGNTAQPTEQPEVIQGTMIRFLPDVLKFRMVTPPKGFSLETLPPKMPTTPDLLLRPINGVPCGILTDAAIARTDKTTKRDKAGDLVYLTTKNQGGVHLHGEHGKLINRADILWHKEFETQAQRKAKAADLWKDYQKAKDIAIEQYIPKLMEWIRDRYVWEFALALELYELDTPQVTWPTSHTEKYLIDTDQTTKELAITNAMLNDLLTEELPEDNPTGAEANTPDSNAVSGLTYTASSSTLSTDTYPQPDPGQTDEPRTPQEPISPVAKKPSTKTPKAKRQRTGNTQLHEHLQAIIMPRYTAINDEAPVTRDESQAAGGNCQGHYPQQEKVRPSGQQAHQIA
jgi:hypothetical protein